MHARRRALLAAGTALGALLACELLLFAAEHASGRVAALLHGRALGVARLTGGEVRFLEGYGHAPMLGPRATEAMDGILAWLRQRTGTAPAIASTRFWWSPPPRRSSENACCRVPA